MMQSLRPVQGLCLGLLVCVGGAGCAVDSNTFSQRRGLRSEKATPEKLVAIASAFETQGRYQQAESMYLQALVQNPDDTLARNGIARVVTATRAGNSGGLTDNIVNYANETQAYSQAVSSAYQRGVARSLPSTAAKRRRIAEPAAPSLQNVAGPDALRPRVGPLVPPEAEVLAAADTSPSLSATPGLAVFSAKDLGVPLPREGTPAARIAAVTDLTPVPQVPRSEPAAASVSKTPLPATAMVGETAIPRESVRQPHPARASTRNVSVIPVSQSAASVDPSATSPTATANAARPATTAPVAMAPAATVQTPAPQPVAATPPAALPAVAANRFVTGPVPAPPVAAIMPYMAMPVPATPVVAWPFHSMPYAYMTPTEVIQNYGAVHAPPVPHRQVVAAPPVVAAAPKVEVTLPVETKQKLKQPDVVEQRVPPVVASREPMVVSPPTAPTVDTQPAVASSPGPVSVAETKQTPAPVVDAPSVVPEMPPEPAVPETAASVAVVATPAESDSRAVLKVVSVDRSESVKEDVPALPAEIPEPAVATFDVGASATVSSAESQSKSPTPRSMPAAPKVAPVPDQNRPRPVPPKVVSPAPTAIANSAEPTTKSPNRLVSLEEVKQAAASRNVGSNADEPLDRTIDGLLRALSNTAAPDRQAAAATLLVDAPANNNRVNVALDHHSTSDSDIVAAAACESLLVRGLVSKPMIYRLLALSESSDEAVRSQLSATLRLLAETPWENEAVRVSLLMLNDASLSVRGMAALTLSDFPRSSEVILEHLSERYAIETDQSTRASVELAAERISAQSIR